MSNIPDDLRYTKTHEWVKLEEDGTIKFGITDHAQSLLGEIVYVELPEVETQIKSGDECGVIESVKAASDLYAPVNGEFIAVNEELDDAPETVNKDSYGAGWIGQIQLLDEGEWDELLDAEAYRDLISGESD